MKTLWNFVSFLAVINLLALIMFVGWLWRTHRLDGARVQEVRALLSTTIADEEAKKKDAAAEAARLKEKQDEEARRHNPPLPSSDNVNAQQRSQQAGLLAARHVDDTRQQLQRQIDQTAQLVQQQRNDMAAQRAGTAGDPDAAAKQEKQQMARAVGLLESQPPKQARLRILELVRTGKIDTAVAYLNAMNPRAASKVLATFKTDQDNPLATELLERIRTLRLPKAAASPEPANAQPATASASRP